MYNPTKPYNAILSEQAKRTWKFDSYVKVTNGYLHRQFWPLVWEIDHTDGIGSKGFFHWEYRTFRNAVLDALAMNLNDLLMYRVTPYKLQNHIYLPNDDEDAIRTIATALADECVTRHIVISGGECAIHNHGLEISITMSGFTEQRCENKWEAGDILIGLGSSGIHSNGITLARDLTFFKPEWLTPTHIYTLPTWPLIIKGIQHITGGAFTKIKHRLSDVDAIIHRHHGLTPQDVFMEINSNLHKQAYTESMMYKTFNCGIGMVLAVDKKYVDKVIKKVGGEVIGELRPGTNKVVIESMFSDNVFNI